MPGKDRSESRMKKSIGNDVPKRRERHPARHRGQLRHRAEYRHTPSAGDNTPVSGCRKAPGLRSPMHVSSLRPLLRKSENKGMKKMGPDKPKPMKFP